jgi:hypothetical protein
MIEGLQQRDIAYVINRLPVETPAGHASEQRGAELLTDASFGLVDAGNDAATKADDREAGQQSVEKFAKVAHIDEDEAAGRRQAGCVR